MRATKGWILTALNTVVMLILTFIWMNQPRTYGDETFFVKWLTVIKRTILNLDDKPNYKEYLFIDVAEAKSILPLTEDSSRVAVISDRQKLTELFDFIYQNNNQIKLVVCDVLFDNPSVLDKKLEKSIQQINPKFIGINELEANSIKEPIIKIPTASSSIFVEHGTIIKYPVLLKDTIQTVPAAMLQKLDNQSVVSAPPLVKIGQNKLSLGSPILELSVREIDFSTQDSSYIKIGLGEIVSLIRLLGDNKDAQSQLFSHYFKNKIILIGDFVNDRHSTIYGDMPGTLIILNAYLTLKHGKSLLSVGLILFLLLGFGIISYTFFIDGTIRIKGVALKILEHERGILHFFYYYGLFLTAMTVIVYYVFGMHIGIFFHLLYLKVIDWLYRKKYLEWLEEIKIRLKKLKSIYRKIIKN